MLIMPGCTVLNSQMNQGRLVQFLEGRKTGEDVSSNIIALLGICFLMLQRRLQPCWLHFFTGSVVGPQVSAECLGWAAQAVLFSVVNIFERTFEFKWLFLPGLLSGQFRDYIECSLLNADHTQLLPPWCGICILLSSITWRSLVLQKAPSQLHPFSPVSSSVLLDWKYQSPKHNWSQSTVALEGTTESCAQLPEERNHLCP